MSRQPPSPDRITASATGACTAGSSARQIVEPRLVGMAKPITGTSTATRAPSNPLMLVEFALIPVRKQARAYRKQRRARRTDLSGFATGIRASLGRSPLIMNAESGAPRIISSGPRGLVARIHGEHDGCCGTGIWGRAGQHRGHHRAEKGVAFSAGRPRQEARRCAPTQPHDCERQGRLPF